MNNALIKQQAVLMSLILGFFLAFTANVYAEKGDGKMGPDKKVWEEKVNKMYDELGLNEQQRTALKQHKQAHRTEMKALREQVQAKREEFQNEIQKGDFDEGKLQDINKQISALQEKMGEHRLQGIVEVRKILTPEQFTKFQELKEDHKDEWRDHFKKGHEYRKEGKSDK